MMGSRVLLFDLDGTLVDSAPDLAEALDFVLVEHGLKPIGLAQTRRMIGHGIPKLVEEGFSYRGRKLKSDLLAHSIDRFREHYSNNLSVKTRIYPGVIEGLTLLFNDGWSMSVCTNKLESYARKILEDLGLIQFFKSVVGPDTFGISKPDPRQLLRTLPDRYDAAIVIGDSEVDVAAAKAAFLPIIAVSYGYCQVPVKLFSPDLVVSNFSEVPEAIKSIMSNFSKKL
jgi:phosphoglycolate phosphatase